MDTSNRYWLGSGFSSVLVGAFAMSLLGCVPLETVQKPTLREVRLGNVQGQVTEDARLRPGEVQGEVDQIDRSRREIHVLADGRGRRVIPYDIDRTHVVYHGWDYSVNDLESGDLIAYFPVTRDRSYVDTIRIEEPVQARPVSSARRAPLPPRNDVVEGTVERIDIDRGLFDVRPRSGDTVTVSVPYNARATDVDYFRSLRRGDSVRVEGEFINRDNLQLLSFLSSRGR